MAAGVNTFHPLKLMSEGKKIKVKRLIKMEVLISQVEILWRVDVYHHQYVSTQELQLASAVLKEATQFERLYSGYSSSKFA